MTALPTTPPAATRSARWFLVLVAAIGVVLASVGSAGPGGLTPGRGALTIAVVVAAAAAVAVAMHAFEWFVVGLLIARASLDVIDGPGLPLDVTSATAVALVAMAVVWLPARLAGLHVASLQRPEAVAVVGVCFLAWATASLLWTPVPTTTGAEVARTASAFLMFGVARHLATTPDARIRLATAVLAASAVPVLAGGAQAARGTGTFIAGFTRTTGTFQHPNPFAIFLALSIVVALGLAAGSRGRRRVALSLWAVATGVVLITTFTRSAWIGLAAALLAVGWVAARHRGLVITVLLVGMLAFHPAVRDRFADLGEERYASGDASNSFVWRLDHWGQTLALARDRPATGAGYGAVGGQADDGRLAHNDYVRVAAELGATGLALYLILLVVAARTALRGRRRSVSASDRGIATAALGGIALYATVSLSDNLVSQVVLVWYVAALLGIASAVARPPAGGRSS